MKRSLQKIAVIGCALTFTVLACSCDFNDVLRGDFTPHEHTLEYRPETESTCRIPGVVEHWKCTTLDGCGKCFSDAEASNELTSITKPLLPHDMTHHEGTEATCVSKGERAYYLCSLCGCKYADENGTVTLYPDDLILDMKSHTTEFREEKSKTCTEDGEKEHFYCTGCHKKFKYNYGGELSDEELRIPAGHRFSTSWSSDESEHWREVLCEHKGVLTKEAHDFDGEVCTVCRRHKPSLGLAYKINDDGVTASVTGRGDCKDTAIYIAETYEGKPVTEIAENAFEYCKDLTSVSIPKHTTKIGRAAFYECSALRSVNIPSKVTAIDDYTFSGCNSLKYVSIPSSVTTIGDRAFDNCWELTSVYIPKSVTAIGAYAFNQCRKLETVSGGGGLTSIGSYAFYGADELTSVSLTYVDAEIQNYAFWNCVKLNDVKLNGVKVIGDSAFEGCSELASLTIGKEVVSIGNAAFKNCGKLASVKQIKPSALKTIGDEAFYGCTLLNKFILPRGLESIGARAFYMIDKLTRVDIPNTVLTIGSQAFKPVRNYMMHIYTEAFSKPQGWAWDWESLCDENWGGYKEQDY